MQGDKVEEITEKLEGSLSIDTGKMEKYDRYRQEGKEAALSGDLQRALELFKMANQLQPSDKLKKRIQAIQEIVQREDEEEEEEDDFVNVNGSGLNLYKGLYDKLYDHQKEGVAFLYSLHRDGRKGGILADDMGLGKTIQVISFLSGMYDAELANHTLLVMPTSLIKNWVREFAKWTPGMRVKEFHGSSKAERNRNLDRIQRKGGVIITTYQMLINNYEQLATYNQREFRWDYVILDEAHKIKTSSTKTAKSAHAIPAHNRVLLTGTPVQNNLRELWALFDFACHGSLLGTSKTFKTEYENPITRAREKDSTPGEKALGLRISQNLMDIIKPYFLRRTKADVQNKKERHCEEANQDENQENKCPNADEGAVMPSLTRKNDLIVWTYLSSVQEDIYNQFISLDRIKELLMTTRSPLAELTVLKKLCDHPRLLSARAVAQLGLDQGTNSTPIENMRESAASQIEHISDDTLIGESGKLQFLVSLMECLREEGHRTLIFSQSRKMLDIMERVLRNRGFRLLRLDGTVTHLTEREKRITLFQTDRRYTIFLLTTQVGGVGITLTAANRVVIFDPSWNPATDAQAVDRAYRIGQTENVLIYRLITCGTVEEKIYRRQVFKDSLIRQTTGDKKNPFRYFSKQELRELFKLEDTRSSSTQQQLQAMHAQNRRSDTKLDQHIAQLYSMEMFGISDHDLMFTKEAAADEDAPENAESHHYIQTRVQKAQELMQAESELHGQLMDSIAQNTEPAWLRQSGQRGIQKSAGIERPAPPHDDVVTVDLTHYSIDEPEDEEEQSSLSVEEVQFVGKDEEEDAFPWAGGERNTSVLKAKDDSAEDSHPVITLDDSLNVADESKNNTASEQQNSLHDLSSLSHKFPKLEEPSVVSDHLDTAEAQTDVVLSPSTSPVAKSVKSSKTDLESSKTDLESSKTDLESSKTDLESSKTDLESSKTDLESSKTDLESSKTDLESSKTDLESSKTDLESSKTDLESSKTDLESSKTDLESSKTELESSKTELESSKTELESSKTELESSKTELESSKTELESSKTELESSKTELESSKTEPEPFKTDLELLQGNFNLQLEDSADMFSAEEEVHEEEESLVENSLEFQLQMDVSGERLEEPSVDDCRRISNYIKCEVSKHESPLRQRSILGTPADDSFVHSVRRKKRRQVISDSEEEGEEELEMPCLSSSPLSDGLSKLGSSTPKSTLANGARLRRSLNTSVASRRSLVMSMLENESDEESSEPSEGENESYQMSAASEAYADESVMEEEPNGETLNTDECDEEDEVEESLEMTGDQLEVEESTNDVELESSEMMEQCAPKTIPTETYTLAVGTINSDETPSENTYEALVLSGKRCLANGRKQEALDYFLKAIDVNTGDPEIQLMIIQLYRQLSQQGQ
ncbi:DNA excision repair protein ERCC-6-like [Triplophysa dalaica]|uniref:DNA excision repair protein ERCC-6-like n=1 Tax=Triplophysa dalaica TaxID=1582913 RepID=UPI0024DF4D3C|nr:DNA excision repair protein ERCC-6-like [Triplophysa dalaica]